MEILLESLNQEWHNLLRLAPRILTALIVMLISYWVGRGVGKAVIHVLARGHLTATHKNFFRSLISWLFILIGFIAALSILGLRTLAASLLAGGGITAVAIGFAFRGIGENFLAGLFLAFSRPFNVGDLIQSGDLQGIVESIELRHTHIRTADARDIFIPSSQIFNEPIINFTRDGLRRPSFTVGIDYADDSEKARDVLLQAMSNVADILKDRPPTATISAFMENYVEIEVFFWIDTFTKGISLPAVRTRAMEKCRCALVEAGFTVSSNVAINLEGAGGHPFRIQLTPGDAGLSA